MTSGVKSPYLFVFSYHSISEAVYSLLSFFERLYAFDETKIGFSQFLRIIAKFPLLCDIASANCDCALSLS